MTPKPNRRVTALATLAFASAVTGSAAGAAAAQANTNARGKAPQNTRATARPTVTTSATDARLTLPAELDIDALATELGVHPGRLAAAMRRLTPDASRSVGGLDPLTALARELDLPPTDVYLAAARYAARGNERA